MTPVLSYIVVGSTGILGMIFNNRGLIGLLPIIATVEYVVVSCKKNISVRSIKVSFLICSLLWIVYDIAIINISALIGHIGLSVVTIGNLLKDTKKTTVQLQNKR